MKTRMILVILSTLITVMLLPACGSKETDTSAGKACTSEKPDDPLLRLLRFVPDRPEYRETIAYGDIDSWHKSWDIPRVNSLMELQELGIGPPMYWLALLGSQTAPQQTLGSDTIYLGDHRAAYGFDLLNLDRFLVAGNPPEWITITEFGFENAQIADALVAEGYSVEPLEGDGQLFSIHGDYELSRESTALAGKTGDMNRIALLDGGMVIGKATANVTRALEADGCRTPSLAQNPDYLAAVSALREPTLEGMGELIGVMFVSGADLVDPEKLLGDFATEEQVQKIKESVKGPPLPLYTLAAFATRHTEGATYLILAVVFPEGTDAEAAADILADRLQNYHSWRFDASFADRWTAHKALGLEAQGLPVSVVVMRLDDPPNLRDPAADERPYVLSWLLFVNNRDMLFLMPE